MTRMSAADDGRGGLTRNRPVVPESTAFLIVDVQNYSIAPGRGEWAHIDPDHVPEEMEYYFGRVKQTVMPNIKRLQDGCRHVGIEVMFTVIESLTLDGRDRGLDYKISGFLVPKGSDGARVPAAVGPFGDEMVIPKGSSSVFNSTNIEYILRSLEVDYLVIAGLITDQCVETAVRDACDRGFLVTLITDACGTYSPERQAASLKAVTGYCRQVTTDEFLAEIQGNAS